VAATDAARHNRQDAKIITADQTNMLKQDNTRKTACSALALKLFSFGRKKDGVVSIEAALLFPVMILLLLGMIDITMLLSAKRKVTVASSAIVDLTTQVSTNVNTGELSGFMDAVDSILQPYSSTDIKIEMFNFRPNGSNVTEVWNHKRGSCGGVPSNMNTTELKKLTQEGNDILVGRVCVNFKPVVGYVLGTGTVSC
jgi:hypothetical protein